MILTCICSSVNPLIRSSTGTKLSALTREIGSLEGRERPRRVADLLTHRNNRAIFIYFYGGGVARKVNQYRKESLKLLVQIKLQVLGFGVRAETKLSALTREIGSLERRERPRRVVDLLTHRNNRAIITIFIHFTGGGVARKGQPV